MFAALAAFYRFRDLAFISPICILSFGIRENEEPRLKFSPGVRVWFAPVRGPKRWTIYCFLRVLFYSNMCGRILFPHASSVLFYFEDSFFLCFISDILFALPGPNERRLARRVSMKFRWNRFPANPATLSATFGIWVEFYFKGASTPCLLFRINVYLYQTRVTDPKLPPCIF